MNETIAHYDRLDRIELIGLRFMTINGITDQERVIAQPLEFDITLYADLSQAGETDRIADTVDYGQICLLLEAVIAKQHDFLLERLAARAAESILTQPKVMAVTVSLKKLRPPVPSNLTSCSVVIHRSRLS